MILLKSVERDKIVSIATLELVLKIKKVSDEYNLNDEETFEMIQEIFLIWRSNKYVTNTKDD